MTPFSIQICLQPIILPTVYRPRSSLQKFLSVTCPPSHPRNQGFEQPFRCSESCLEFTLCILFFGFPIMVLDSSLCVLQTNLFLLLCMGSPWYNQKTQITVKSLAHWPESKCFKSLFMCSSPPAFVSYNFMRADMKFVTSTVSKFINLPKKMHNLQLFEI